MTAISDTPEFDGVIPTTGRQKISRLGEADAKDDVRMSFERANLMDAFRRR